MAKIKTRVFRKHFEKEDYLLGRKVYLLIPLLSSNMNFKQF